MTALRILVPLIGFAVCAVFWVPLRVVTDAAPVASGVRIAAVAGTVWLGSLQDVSWRGVFLGDFNVETQPASLASGEIRLAFASNGPVSRGDVVWNGSGPSAEKLSGRLALTTFISQAPAEVGIVFRDVRIKPSGNQCEEASGQISIDAVPRYDLAAFAGDVSCEQGAAIFRLTQEGGGPSIEIQVDLAAAPDVNLVARTSDPGLRSGLALLGLKVDAAQE